LAGSVASGSAGADSSSGSGDAANAAATSSLGASSRSSGAAFAAVTASAGASSSASGVPSGTVAMAPCASMPASSVPSGTLRSRLTVATPTPSTSAISRCEQPASVNSATASRRYAAEKQSHGGDRKSSGQSDHLNEKTAEIIAATAGVSEKTVRRGLLPSLGAGGEPRLESARRQAPVQARTRAARNPLVLTRPSRPSLCCRTSLHTRRPVRRPTRGHRGCPHARRHRHRYRRP
jgi:hypothetical protein